jgi:hypothetical protein
VHSRKNHSQSFRCAVKASSEVAGAKLALSGDIRGAELNWASTAFCGASSSRLREIPRTGKMDELLDLESHLSDLFFERLNLLKNPFNREKLESRTLLMVHVVDAMLSSYTFKMKNRIPRKEFVNEVTNLIVTYLNSNT